MSVKNVGAYVDYLFSSSPWKVTVSLGGDDEGVRPLGFLASFLKHFVFVFVFVIVFVMTMIRH